MFIMNITKEMKKIKNNSMKWQLKTSHNLCLNTILAGKQKSNPQRSLIKVYRYLNTICHTHDQFKTYTNNMSLRHDNNCVLYAHLKIYKMFDVWALWVWVSFVMIYMYVMVCPLVTKMKTAMAWDCCWYEQL